MSNRCNCESMMCARRNAHPVCNCHKLNTRQIMAFGLKETLCEDCIAHAKRAYPKNVIDPAPCCTFHEVGGSYLLSCSEGFEVLGVSRRRAFMVGGAN